MTATVLTASDLVAPAEARTPSGIVRRAGAAAVDAFFLWAAFVVVALLLAPLPSGAVGVLSLLAWVVIPPLYGLLSMRRPAPCTGQTPGKTALGIRVVRVDGRPVDLRTLLVREVVAKTVLGAATLGIFSAVDLAVALASRDRRSLHDRIARTIVVRD
jgi:uncharacterized RDD family membrane protein YckC